MTNRLKSELSPYLLQHADNPVNWHPWDDTALQKAIEENKPIFLSIGYAACHWCHVMEKESFQEVRIARLLNEGFVPIKVDREERPDLDNIYMAAVVALTGQGGWPLNVFLTPEGQPFYGGTYYPPVPIHGLPSFEEVLRNIMSLWHDRRGTVEDLAQKVTEHLVQTPTKEDNLTDRKVADILDHASQTLLKTYDWKNGGWGKAPKFPQPMLLEYLLMQAVRGQPGMLDAVTHALMSMSTGGLFDLIEGGFHRYSTDSDWLVPHFEKMLYDNAQLARIYLHAYLITKNPDFLDICRKTMVFMEKHLLHPSGGFFSSLDADSEGEEGKYYVWSHDELKNILADDFDAFHHFFEISPSGNFEGKIILRNKQHSAENENITNAENLVLEQGLQKLAQARSKRVKPALDDKIILSWNALALQLFAEAAFYLHEGHYLEIAQKNANFLLSNLMIEGQLYRIWRDRQARVPAFLEDYASFIHALLAIHQADRQPRWLITAHQLTQQMEEIFGDQAGGFFDVSTKQDKLIYRPKDLVDNATPSGNALAAYALVKVNQLTHNLQREKKAVDAFRLIVSQVNNYPSAFGYWLQALDFFQGPVSQIAIIWQDNPISADPFFAEMKKDYCPRRIIVGSDRQDAESKLKFVELVQDRALQDLRATAFVCTKFSCKLPTNEPKKFSELIKKC